MAICMLAVFAMLPSCSGGSNKKNVLFVVPDGGYDGSEVTITFYHTMDRTSAQFSMHTSKNSM